MDYSLMRRRYEAAVKAKETETFFEEIRTALDTKQLRPEDFSFKGLFSALVPDGRSIIESWDPRNAGNGCNLNRLDEISLMESGATVSSSFSNITGQIIYSTVMEAYTDEEFAITPLVKTVPSMFNGEKIPGITRLGDGFESIGEGQPYPIAGVGEDYIQTPQTVKRGEIVPVTKEAIFFDRTGLILERASELGTFYGMNKEKRLIDAVIDENVTTYRYNWRGAVYATFQGSTPWVNLVGSNGLVDWTNLNSAELTLSKIVDPNTGEPILITPKHLLVSRTLKPTARQIITATQVRKGDGSSNTAVTIGLSPIDTEYKIVSSPLLGQHMALQTNWYIGDIGKAVKYMENWPMTIEEAPTNSEAEFTSDIVKRWKVSERGSATVVEPRALIKNTA